MQRFTVLKYRCWKTIEHFTPGGQRGFRSMSYVKALSTAWWWTTECVFPESGWIGTWITPLHWNTDFSKVLDVFFQSEWYSSLCHSLEGRDGDKLLVCLIKMHLKLWQQWKAASDKLVRLFYLGWRKMWLNLLSEVWIISYLVCLTRGGWRHTESMSQQWNTGWRYTTGCVWRRVHEE